LACGLLDSATLAQRMKFTGHQRDNLVGGVTDDMDYMQARYGSPMTGRFLSVDPVLGSPGDPQSWNRFAYVRGKSSSTPMARVP
jgi:RHS repeat-associated protein